jgi:hypothetical protein
LLSKGRETKQRGGNRYSLPMAASTTIHKGALVVQEAGMATFGRTATGLIAIGVAENSATSIDAIGDVRVDIRSDGLFNFTIDPADPITGSDIGSDCYIFDDETVSKTDGTNTRSVAGIIRDVEIDNVWIEFK